MEPRSSNKSCGSFRPVSLALLIARIQKIPDVHTSLAGAFKFSCKPLTLTAMDISHLFASNALLLSSINLLASLSRIIFTRMGGEWELRVRYHGRFSRAEQHQWKRACVVLQDVARSKGSRSQRIQRRKTIPTKVIQPYSRSAPRVTHSASSRSPCSSWSCCSRIEYATSAPKQSHFAPS